MLRHQSPPNCTGDSLLNNCIRNRHSFNISQHPITHLAKVTELRFISTTIEVMKLIFSLFYYMYHTTVGLTCFYKTVVFMHLLLKTFCAGGKWTHPKTKHASEACFVFGCLRPWASLCVRKPSQHHISTRAHHGDEIPERDVTYHLTCLLIYHWTTTHL